MVHGHAHYIIHIVPNPSVSVTSNPLTPVLDGTNVTVTCTVEMGEGVSQSDLSLLMVDAQLSRDGTALDRTGPVISGTTFTYTFQLYSFRRSDSGTFNCTATVRPQQTSTYLTGVGVMSTSTQISTSELRFVNSHIYVKCYTIPTLADNVFMPVYLASYEDKRKYRDTCTY